MAVIAECVACGATVEGITAAGGLCAPIGPLYDVASAFGAMPFAETEPVHEEWCPLRPDALAEEHDGGG